ncbi:MAG TPA: SAM-dependent methyltransferase [Pseudonocardiaceae bacterium]|nr:SAM-dependent methyltransferase [Pseudonocardiaceae bacterium]
MPAESPESTELEPTEPDAPNPAEFDVTRPNAARMYDYFLGGAHNLAIDRELADRTIAIMPGIVATARANRAFLQRAVQYCMRAGIRQYLDLGSGIPTVGHVHEVAHRIDRAARVAYVDIEPVAVAQTKRILAHVPTATVTKADITDPKEVLASPGIAELIDFSQPVAIVACAVLHFVPDSADPVGVLHAYRDHVSPGGALVFSHGASSLAPEQSEQLHALYKQTTQPGHRRTKEDMEALLAGWSLVEPGLVDAAAWRPELDTPDAGPVTVWAAVGRR